MARYKVVDSQVRKLAEDMATFLRAKDIPTTRAAEFTDRDLWNFWHHIHGHYTWGDDNPNVPLWCGRRLVEPDPTIPLYINDSNDATMTTALRRAASYCAKV